MEAYGKPSAYPLAPPKWPESGGVFLQLAPWAEPFARWLGSHVTHSPTDRILIPAAVAEPKPMAASGCLGSTLPNRIALDKVITESILRNSKVSVFFVGLTDQIKPQDPEGYLQSRPWSPAAFPSPGSLATNFTQAVESEVIYTTWCQDEIVFLKGFLMSLPYSEPLRAPACCRNKIWTLQHDFQALSDLTTHLSLSPAFSDAGFTPTPTPEIAQHVARCSDSTSSRVSPLCFALAVSLPGIWFSHHRYLSQLHRLPNKTSPSTCPLGSISNVHTFLQLFEPLLCRAVILSSWLKRVE